VGKVGFDSGGDEGKDVAALLAASLDDRKHRFHPGVAVAALEGLD